jgi:hypothetical protein
MKNNNLNVRKYVSLLIILFLSMTSIAQMITFEKHYPTDFDKSGKDVLPTDDGGYMIAATTENGDPNDLDIQMIKTNSYGEITAAKTIGGLQVDFPNGMLRTNDGNFFVIGYTRSNGAGDMDVYLLKINQNGDLLFSKKYGGWANEEGKEIIATADGNYLIVGGTSSSSSCDMFLIKIQPDGTEIWTKYYGGQDYQSGRSVKLCPDGGYIIAGKTALNPTSISSILLVKTNADGDVTWTKTYSDAVSSYEGKYVLANNDGTYTLAADDSTAEHDSDVKIMKLSNTGDIIWNKEYGGSLKDISKDIQSTTDGGYILGAISRSFGWINPDMWIIKLDANGDSEWTKHFGGSEHEHLYFIRQTTDNGYIAIGHARSFSDFWEVYFLKLDPSGAVGLEEFAMDNKKFNLYPNPTDGIINIDLNEVQDFKSFKIRNSLGQIIFSEEADKIKQNPGFFIDLKDQKPGIYFVTIESSTNTSMKKLILN